MRISYLMILLPAVLCASICATGLDMLFTYTANDTAEVPIETITAGRVHQMFLTPYFWASYPAVPSLYPMLDMPTLTATSLAILAVTLYLRLQFWVSWRYVGLACLAFPLFLWIVGLLLLNGNSMPERGGVWCSMVLLSGLLSMCICAVFQIVDLISREHFQWRKKVKLAY